MKCLVLSSATGACLSYQDCTKDNHGPGIEPAGLGPGSELSAKLYDMNIKLLEATGALPAEQQHAPAHKRMADTILGMGSRGLRAGKSAVPRLALRQWHHDQDQWLFADDVDCGIILAMCLPKTWPAEAALQFTRACRDTFVQQYRQQLLALATAAANAAAAGHTVLGSMPHVPANMQLPADALRSILVLQALRTVRKLAADAENALQRQQPCWLYFAHVASFMGAYAPAAVAALPGHPGSADSQAPGHRTSAEGADGTSKKPKKSIKNAVMSLFGSHKAVAAGRSSTGGAAAALRAQQQAAMGPWNPNEPGPVGQLQHLMVTDSVEANGVGVWDPTSIAAAVLQVKPPVPEDSDAIAAEVAAGNYSFLDLEDVELEMELQAPSADSSSPGSPATRQYSVVGIRQGHALAVVALPSSATGDAGRSSHIRSELGPSILTPMSTLFEALACIASQDDVASRGLLLRLLE